MSLIGLLRSACLASLLVGVVNPAVLVVLASTVVPAQALAQRFVIPPGQEQLSTRMLALDGSEAGALCTLVSVAIEQSRIHARYRCGPGKQELTLELSHRDDSADALAETEKFSISVAGNAQLSSLLVEAVVERVKIFEHDWKWVAESVQSVATRGEAGQRVDETVVSEQARDGLATERRDLHAEAFELYRSGDSEKALGVSMELAAAEPTQWALGMVVATLASTHPSLSRVLELASAADLDPEDPLRQFVAGVAHHYYGHQSGRSVEEKHAHYRRCIYYLDRAKEAYDFEPRLFIYLAVSHYRLGHQKLAEVAIERAVLLGDDDPDAYYCRAEVMHRIDPRRAIEDIDHYLEMMEKFAETGAVVADTKTVRVRRMRDSLEALQPGETPPEELFDPIELGSREWEPEDVLPVLQVLTAAFLLGFSLFALPLAYLRAWSVWNSSDRSACLLMASLIAAAAAARWLLAPRWIATVHIGYRWTQQCLDLLPLSHYGAGAEALYHAIFLVFPAHHETLMWTNSIIGVLFVPLVATYAVRVLEDHLAGLFMAGFVALVPLLVRNDNSDANNVPCLWWMFAGLVLWDEYLQRGGSGSLAGSLGLLTLAAVARPEMLGLVPCAVVVTTWMVGGSRRPWTDVRCVGGCVLGALGASTQVLHVLRATQELGSRSSLPGFDLKTLFSLPHLLASVNVLIRPDLFPSVLVFLALLGVVFHIRDLRTPSALSALIVVSWVAYIVDLDEANMARVQVPAALFVMILASAGSSAIWGRLRHRGLKAGFLGVMVASAIPTVSGVWVPTNERTEDLFIADSLAMLPSERYVLVHIGPRDRARFGTPVGPTHDHLPRYLIEPPQGSGQLVTIGDWIDAPDTDLPGFFLQGMRCYAEFRRPADPTPEGDNLAPSCAEMHRRFELEPVLERDVTNRGDVWIHYYGDSPTLRLGLYRIGATKPLGANDREPSMREDVAEVLEGGGAGRVNRSEAH